MNGVFFSDAMDPYGYMNQGGNRFYLLRPCAQVEEKRDEKFAKFSQYRMKTLLFIMQTRKLPKQIMAKFN